jgi:hypothetical protein
MPCYREGQSEVVALVVKKIIEEIAKRFHGMYPLYVLRSSHGNNSSSSIAAEEQQTVPPRKHATRKRHKHDKRDS